MIPTAEELLEKYENTVWTLPDVMREFAKIHVEAALETASIEGEVEEKYGNPYDPNSLYHIVDKESILNAYPLTNIK